MKSITPIYFFVFMAVLLASCYKGEKIPVDPLKESIIFDEEDINGYYAEQFLNNIYSDLPRGFNRIDNAILDAATDDAISSEPTSNIEILGKAMLNPFNNVDDVYNKSYAAIRKVNLFLSKITVVPVSDSIQLVWSAEARFVRAISYFELIKRYGGVPLIGDKILNLNDNLQIPKNSFEECVGYIVSECNAISPILMKEPVTANFVGRITQGAALALKSRTLLYAASPLFNSSNDPAKWQAAFDAAKAVIDLNYYALNSNLLRIFVDRTTANKEVILAFQESQKINIETNNAPVGYSAQNVGSGLTSPTQELVDAFVMVNGRSVSDPASGYDANLPYANRDPRLYATVFHNGSRWLNRSVETFEGGRDKPGGQITQTRTGYYMRKFMGDFANVANYTNQDHNFIIFRYAEMLLNYAEAANELNQTTVAYDQLKALRARAGITAGTGSLYGLKASMTQSEMREAIQLERRLEMAFEEQRFWDARRWKIAETVFNKQLHGMRILQGEGGAFSYEIIPVSEVVFKAPKMYLYPFPFSEIQKNRALIQNPGWQ